MVDTCMPLKYTNTHALSKTGALPINYTLSLHCIENQEARHLFDTE